VKKALQERNIPSSRDRIKIVCLALFSARCRVIFLCVSNVPDEVSFSIAFRGSGSLPQEVSSTAFKQEQPDKIYKTKQTAVPSPRMMRRFIKSRSVALLVFLSPAPLSLFLSTSFFFFAPASDPSLF